MQSENWKLGVGLQFREYVHDMLYHPTEGYFTKEGISPVGRLPKPLDLSSMKNKGGYLRALHQLYTDLQVFCLVFCVAYSLLHAKLYLPGPAPHALRVCRVQRGGWACRVGP